MKLSSIFVDKDLNGLHSACYKEHKFKSEFNRILNLWNDPLYIRKYLTDNLNYLESGFYGDISLEEAIIEVRKDINVIQQEILEASENIGKNNGKNFESLFQPLYPKESHGKDHQRVKYKLEGWEYNKSKIRLYAIRLTKYTFIITGAAIKLVGLMNQHPDTIRENEKINLVRDWLKKKEIYFEDNLSEYYEEK